MKYDIRGKNIEVTETISEKVKKQLNKLDKYNVIDEDATAKVVVKVYPKEKQTIKVSIPVKNDTLVAEASAENLYDAIDEVGEKLRRQVKRTHMYKMAQ